MTHMEIIEVENSKSENNKNVVVCQESSKEEIPYICEEVIQNILTLLPFDSLLNSRLVCKLWSNIICHPIVSYRSLPKSEPGLIIQQKYMLKEGHFKTYFLAMKDEQITVREFNSPYLGNIYCSCNGLVLLRGKQGELCISNFVTKQQVTLHCGTLPDTVSSVSFGFAFVPSSREYKVVHLYEKKNGNGNPYIRCEILTLGFKQKWRHVDLPPLFIKPRHMPISAKGFLNWYSTSMDLMGSILSIDMCDEKIYNISLPSGSKPFKILDIGSFLSLLSQDFLKVTVWILKDSYQGIWVNLLQIDLGDMPGLRSLSTIDFLGSLKYGKVIILRRHCKSVPCYYHYAYDIEHHQMRKVAINMKKGRRYGMVHVNSLISIFYTKNGLIDWGTFQ